MYKMLAVLGAVVVGIAAGLQPPMNAGLGKISNPKLAALLNFLVGGSLVFLVNLFTGSFKDVGLLRTAPWYLLVGGLLGSVIVFGSILTVPIIGTGAALSIFVTFQLMMGMVIDHFGWFGVPKVPIDFGRIAGLVLMIAGIRLIVR